MSVDPSVSRSLDAVTPSVSADPVAEVLARVLSGSDGRAHVAHVAAEMAAALREAGLIPEATTRVEWGVVGGSWNDSDRRVKGPLTTDLGGYPTTYTEALARHDTYGQGRPEDLRRRTVTTYADHVTEWEAVE